MRPKFIIPDAVWDLILLTAKRRHHSKKDRKTSRPLRQDRHLGKHYQDYAYEIPGVMGEWAVRKYLSLPMAPVLEILPFGDGRKNGLIGHLEWDVKAGDRNAYNLLREVGAIHPDILILAGCDIEALSVKLLGWEFDEEMVRCPTKRFHPKGPINHYKHFTKLKPISDLKRWLE